MERLMLTKEVEQLKYTICFCIDVSDGSLLLIHRNNPPNEHKYNGIGGKLEPEEDHLTGVKREAWEEADIILTDNLRFAGVVTWSSARDGQPTTENGMYAYIATLSGKPFQKREIEEGVLEWKPSNWVIDKTNGEIVENIPHFLPHMMSSQSPSQYHCTYVNGELVNFEVFPLEL